MSEDYLWDGSGERDEVVSDLENLFAELRFDEKKSPLVMPQPTQVSWMRRFRIPVAIAASILFLLTAAVIGARFFNRSPSQTKSGDAPVAVSSPLPVSPSPFKNVIPNPAKAIGSPDKNSASNRQPEIEQPNALAKRHAIDVRRANQLAEERREGEQARNELMLALHIAGSKLNQVQKSVSVNKG